jgi:formylglycine-generating enzyme required for sulfatase activity
VPATGSDDVEMVEVPAGEFIMGSTRPQVSEYLDQNSAYFKFRPRGFLYDQTPQLTVHLDAFAIDRVEVTVGRYRRCVEAGFCQPADLQDTLPDDYPVVGVTWHDARAYCHWVGKRLPTEAEWEKAARGTDGRWYPWGNEWGENRANEADDVEDLEPVGSYPKGASPYGVLDVGGNAPEWVADPYGPYPGQPDPTIFSERDLGKRVVRGCQVGLPYMGGGPGAPAVCRGRREPEDTERSIVGFRCVEGPWQDWRNQVMRTSILPTPAPQAPDLSEMAYVPPGEFIMGTGAERNESNVKIGSPAHVVYLDAYYIDRYEVTVAEYVAFLNALGGNRCDGYPCISENPGEIVNRWWIEEVDGVYRVLSGFEDRPVVSVSWWGAQAYCEWVGKRLPTEAEWEKAARGTDGRKYPWGNEWDPERAAAPGRYFDTGVYPHDAGTHPGDVSPYGVYDMLGNAAECVADWFSDTYYLDSPYADPPGPGQTGDYGHVERGYPDGSGVSGLVLRRFFCMGMFTGFRCAYTP